MIRCGTVLFVGMSISAALTVMGVVSDTNLFRWLGMIGLILGCPSFVILLKTDMGRRKAMRSGNPMIWAVDAYCLPSWAAWTIRALEIALIVEAQVVFNRIAVLS